MGYYGEQCRERDLTGVIMVLFPRRAIIMRVHDAPSCVGRVGVPVALFMFEPICVGSLGSSVVRRLA